VAALAAGISFLRRSFAAIPIQLRCIHPFNQPAAFTRNKGALERP